MTRLEEGPGGDERGRWRPAERPQELGEGIGVLLCAGMVRLWLGEEWAKFWTLGVGLGTGMFFVGASFRGAGLAGGGLGVSWSAWGGSTGTLARFTLSPYGVRVFCVGCEAETMRADGFGRLDLGICASAEAPIRLSASPLSRSMIDLWAQGSWLLLKHLETDWAGFNYLPGIGL